MEKEFWNYLDKLVNGSEVVIDRPKWSIHPDHDNEVYPLDYGYLKDTLSSDGGGLDVWVGSNREQKIGGIICTVDLFKMDVEIKVLIACSDIETQTILDFHNNGGMRAILVRK